MKLKTLFLTCSFTSMLLIGCSCGSDEGSEVDQFKKEVEATLGPVVQRVQFHLPLDSDVKVMARSTNSRGLTERTRVFFEHQTDQSRVFTFIRPSSPFLEEVRFYLKDWKESDLKKIKITTIDGVVYNDPKNDQEYLRRFKKKELKVGALPKENPLSEVKDLYFFSAYGWADHEQTYWGIAPKFVSYTHPNSDDVSERFNPGFPYHNCMENLQAMISHGYPLANDLREAILYASITLSQWDQFLAGRLCSSYMTLTSAYIPSGAYWTVPDTTWWVMKGLKKERVDQGPHSAHLEFLDQNKITSDPEMKNLFTAFEGLIKQLYNSPAGPIKVTGILKHLCEISSAREGCTGDEFLEHDDLVKSALKTGIKSKLFWRSIAQDTNFSEDSKYAATRMLKMVGK